MTSASEQPAETAVARPRAGGLWELVRFVTTLAVLAVALRSLILVPFSIPSESMLPRLVVGDYLFVAKWPYGYSRYSFPVGLPLFEGRVLGGAPARGDVIVFKAPPGNSDDYIKRLIGLPGDLVQVSRGQVLLNGDPVPRQRIADLVAPLTPNTKCMSIAPAPYGRGTDAGRPVCRFPRYRETLPGGRSYEVVDQGPTPQDDTEVFVVPAGHYFMMGDNRDQSADSRFPAEPGGGIGFVPAENLEGRALFTFFSTDGSARWLKPWTWAKAARWDRIGEGF